MQATGLAQPNVSAHLACLWECGLSERERRRAEERGANPEAFDLEFNENLDLSASEALRDLMTKQGGND